MTDPFADPAARDALPLWAYELLRSCIPARVVTLQVPRQGRRPPLADLTDAAMVVLGYAVEQHKGYTVYTKSGRNG